MHWTTVGWRVAIELEDAIRSAKDGDGVLFVGAGLSFLSHRADGSPVPNASDLVDLLLEQPAKTGSKHPLDRVSGAVIREKGAEFVYDILQSSFVVSSVDEKLKKLYSLPWKRIYTTNYDNAAEIARAGTSPISSVTIDEPHASAKTGSIIHLNGYVSRVSPANLENGLLLTDASYAASRLVDSGWLSFLERDLNTSRVIIFAGYSLYDLDIDKVLLTTGNISKKAFFFIALNADDIEISTLRRYGTVVPGGIDVLVSEIDDVTSNYRPPRFVTGFTCLREIVRPSASAALGNSAQKLNEQFVYGRLPETEILANEHVFGNQPYLVTRKQDQEAITAVKQGPWQDILFVGEIASGKSASSLNFATYLLSLGYRVFYAIRGNSLAEDLRKLSLIDAKIAVIFDGYSPFRRNISEYAGSRPSTHRIILTERSAVHELVGDFVEKTPHLGPTREIVLNRIEAQDTQEFESLANFGGYWGERAGASIATRQSFISDRLEGSLYRFLLEIVGSEKVQSQLRTLLEPLSSDEDVARAFCSVLILNSLRFPFSINEWQYLFDRNLIRRMLSAYADQVKHFVMADSDNIYLRNGLLSTHLLHAFMDDELVRECLINLYFRAERRARQKKGEEWRLLGIELTKFSTIEPMFSGPTKDTNIFAYYDGIRAIGGTRDNPDYWLQLGIASTVLDDLPRGKLCFENAYSRERARPQPNLTRIDNYFSRFEMRQAVAESDPNIAFKNFIAANERLEKQIFLDINRHYPFKTGRYFSDVAAKHFSRWNSSQRTKFRNAVISMRQKAQDWKDQKREVSVDVEILIRETTSLLKRI